MWEKVKTIALIILGLIVIILTLGVWDPFDIRKKPTNPTKDFEKDRELEKAKTDATIYKDLSDLGSVNPGVNRDDALSDLLDEDYPGKK